MNERYRQALMTGEAAGGGYILSVPSRIMDGLSGGRLGNRPGSSLEFMEHRDYMPGDDLRRLDWNVYARSDRLTVKLFREEVCPAVDLIVDGSRSMALPDNEKDAATLGVAAMLAAAAGNARFMVNSWLAGADCAPVVNGQRPPRFWEGLEFESVVCPSPAIIDTVNLFHRRGVRILISDLFWLNSPEAFLAKFAGGAVATIVVRVLSRGELEPESRGDVKLIDIEGGGLAERRLDDAVVTRYRSRLARHSEAWSHACRAVGAVFCPVVAEEFAAAPQLPELVERELLRCG